MLSIRTRLREAVIQRLQSSKALQASIKTESTIPISIQELPLISVSLDKANSLTDWSALDGNGDLLEMIEQSMVIKITAVGHAKLEEQLEQFAAVASQILVQDETLGGLVKSLRLEEEAELSISHEGEQPIGILTMRFMALYRRHVLNLSATCN